MGYLDLVINVINLIKNLTIKFYILQSINITLSMYIALIVLYVCMPKNQFLCLVSVT